MNNSVKKTIHDESGMILPSEIEAVGVDFPRDLEKLWALELPVEEIPIEELAWHLDLPFFWQPDLPFSLKPSDVLKSPDKYEYRMGRIMGVDENFPIHIIFWKERWVILDGLHRFCKQVVQGKTVIKVKKVPVEFIDKIKPD